MKRILVTGAAGQLGRTLQDLAPNYSNIRFVFKTSSELDITKKHALQLIGRSNFDFCINCAAYTDVENAENEPAQAYLVNSEGVRNLAVACENANVILIHISTDYVFDGEKETPYLPDDIPNPINEYGKSKLEGENHIKQNTKAYFIVRTSWLYSKKYGKNFYRTILEKAKQGGVLRVTDEQTGCPTRADNLAHYILHLISGANIDYGIHHFTDGIALTWYDFAESILKENNLDTQVKLVKDRSYSTFTNRPMYSILQ